MNAIVCACVSVCARVSGCVCVRHKACGVSTLSAAVIDVGGAVVSPGTGVQWEERFEAAGGRGSISCQPARPHRTDSVSRRWMNTSDSRSDAVRTVPLVETVRFNVI